MIEVKRNFGNEGISSSHASLDNYCDIANLYINFIGKDIETSNGCVTMSSEMLAYLIRRAFITGWRCNSEYYDGPNKFPIIAIEDKRTSIHWTALERALDKKKKTDGDTFVNTVYRTPFLTKEYIMKEGGLTEEEWNKLPQKTKDYYSQEYWKDV